MTAKGIYINVFRGNEDIPELIDEFSETLNRSKADTVSEILRSYLKLINYKKKCEKYEPHFEKWGFSTNELRKE